LCLKFIISVHCIGTFSAHTGAVWQIAAQDQLMFTTGSTEHIHVWDLSAPGRIGVLAADAPVHSLCLHSGVLYSGDAQGGVAVWDPKSMERTQSFVACTDIVAALACAGSTLFAASFAVIKVGVILVRTVTDRLLLSVSY
jgi:hypothetical protein